METIKRKCKVFVLPTKDETKIWYNMYHELKYSKPNMFCPGFQEYQHLYIVSDEEIKTGDWFITENKEIKRALYINKGYIHSGNIYKSSDCKKIIASTKSFAQIPSPSLSFIKKYCEANGNITEVMVEYYSEDIYSGTLNQSGPKVNSNNEISISKVKNVWTTEEVEQMMVKYFKKGCNPLNSIEDIRKLLYNNNSK